MSTPPVPDSAGDYWTTPYPQPLELGSYGAHAVAFLRRLRPDGPWPITAIWPEREEKRPALTKTYGPVAGDRIGDADACATAIDSANTTGWNVYYSLNPTRGPVTKKADKADILAVEFFHVDIDVPAAPADATPEQRAEHVAREKARILRLLTTELPEGVPPPTFIIDSGGGFQALWRLRTRIMLAPADATPASSPRPTSPPPPATSPACWTSRSRSSPTPPSAPTATRPWRPAAAPWRPPAAPPPCSCASPPSPPAPRSTSGSATPRMSRLPHLLLPPPLPPQRPPPPPASTAPASSNHPTPTGPPPPPPPPAPRASPATPNSPTPPDDRPPSPLPSLPRRPNLRRHEVVDTDCLSRCPDPSCNTPRVGALRPRTFERKI